MTLNLSVDTEIDIPDRHNHNPNDIEVPLAYNDDCVINKTAVGPHSLTLQHNSRKINIMQP